MNIYEAVQAMRQGHKVARFDWGDDTYIRFYDAYSDSSFKTTEIEPVEGTLMPVIYIRTENHEFMPWTVTQSDLFCSDFQIYKPK